MAFRYLAAFTLTLALAASLPGSAKRVHHRRHKAHPSPPPMAADQIYSKQALRRAKMILELKLLELRRERLERVRKAILDHVPIEQILDQHPRT
jgi:hypothetical protein